MYRRKRFRASEKQDRWTPSWCPPCSQWVQGMFKRAHMECVDDPSLEVESIRLRERGLGQPLFQVSEHAVIKDT